MNETKELVEQYKELPINDKRKELGREIAELTTLTHKLLSDINPNYPVKNVEEYVNLFDGTTSEDDYLTGLYEDVIELANSVETYFDFSTRLYYDESNNQVDDF